MIFSQQLISPKLFYLGNPEDLRDGVGDIFIIVQFVEITYFFFLFSKNFQFFVVAPHQQFFEIFEKVEYLHDHEELGIDNGTVIFSERSSFRKANNF